MITIYSDGSSLGNPGPGGYGVIMDYKGRRKELSKGFRLTTNNRMELLGVIVALESIKKDGWQVKVITDSRYVVDAINKGWLGNWVSKGFKGKKNADLWERLLKSYYRHKIKFEWIKGHAGHPENERCDELAVAAANSEKLEVDLAFEETYNPD